MRNKVWKVSYGMYRRRIFHLFYNQIDTIIDSTNLNLSQLITSNQLHKFSDTLTSFNRSKDSFVATSPASKSSPACESSL